MFLKAGSICQKLQYRRKLTPPFGTIMRKNQALHDEVSKHFSIYLKERWICSLKPFQSNHDSSHANRNAVGIPKAEFVHKPNAWYCWLSIDKARSDWGWSPKTIVVLSFTLLLVDFTVAESRKTLRSSFFSIILILVLLRFIALVVFKFSIMWKAFSREYLSKEIFSPFYLFV